MDAEWTAEDMGFIDPERHTGGCPLFGPRVHDLSNKFKTTDLLIILLLKHSVCVCVFIKNVKYKKFGVKPPMPPIDYLKYISP